MSDKTLPTTINCTLTENALDYLVLAGDQAKRYTPRMLKHAVATLADGIELLLKTPLEMKDWKLVFSTPGKASEASYRSGDFKSVFFEQMVGKWTEDGLGYEVGRLATECGILLGCEEWAMIDSIRKLRNKVRHFAVTVDQNAVISLIARAYKFAFEFIDRNVTKGQPSDPQLNDLSDEFSGFVAKRMEEIRPQMESQTWSLFVDCPTCLQKAMFVDDGTVRCLFCGENQQGEEAASLWASEFFGWQSPKDALASPQVEECDECGAQALVKVEADDADYLCFACGEFGPCEECIDCGKLCFSAGGAEADGDERDDGGPFWCSGCWDNKMWDSND